MTRRIPASRVVAIACLFAGCATHESSAPLVSQTPADGVEAAGVSRSNLDPASRGYLAGIRQAIAAKLFHPPCEGERWKSLLWYCDYKTTRVVVEISILRDGQVRSVTVREPSEYAAYNDAAIRAVQAAAPFPPIPDTMFEQKPAITFRLPIEYAVSKRR